MFKNAIILALVTALALAVFVGIPTMASANGDGCRGQCEAGGDVTVELTTAAAASARSNSPMCAP